jgi:hypothetical protein
MGCGPSSRTVNASSEKSSFVKIVNAKCPHIRLDHNGAPKRFNMEGKNYNYSFNYVYCSQRGFYPTGLYICIKLFIILTGVIYW